MVRYYQFKQEELMKNEETALLIATDTIRLKQ